MDKQVKDMLSIVLPCFNEQDSIQPLLSALQLEMHRSRVFLGLSDWEIIVVDDGSTDESLNRLRYLNQANLKIIRHKRRRGYGAALKTGFSSAKGELIAFFDLDATYDFYALEKMLKQLRSENHALVIGDRLHEIRNMPLTRQIGNFLFRGIIFSSFRSSVSDSCSGQRVFRAQYAKLFSELLPDQLNFSLAMTLLVIRLGIPFSEVPVRYFRRIGRSKLNIVSDGFAFLGTILRFRLIGQRKIQHRTMPWPIEVIAE